MIRHSLLCVGVLVLLLGLGTPGASALADCTVPPDLLQVPVTMPHLAQQLRARRPVTIVAIGGASTLGAAAGSPDFAYPHRLQLALAATYPKVPITVINRGVPRQSAAQMVARFPTDVLAGAPALVIWEVGIVDAVRGVDVDDFAAALQAGVDEVVGRPMDIMLVDMQFSRKTSAMIDFGRYLDAVHRIGDVNEIYVFPRYEMMRYWSEQHMFNVDEVAERERARLAANVYDCVGRKIAEAIRIAVQ